MQAIADWVPPSPPDVRMAAHATVIVVTLVATAQHQAVTTALTLCVTVARLATLRVEQTCKAHALVCTVRRPRRARAWTDGGAQHATRPVRESTPRLGSATVAVVQATAPLTAVATATLVTRPIRQRHLVWSLAATEHANMVAHANAQMRIP